MKHNSTWLLSCLALGILITSCSGKKNDVDKQEQSVSTVLPDAKNEVTTQILKRRDFHHELVSNGKVSALGQADLRIETSEVIARIYVMNGEHVHKGLKIAELDKIPAIELNISCPNVKQGGMAFGVTTCGAAEVVKAVR